MTNDAGFVLVVDDNEMNRDMLSRRLQRQGCEVMVAEDGQNALDLLQEHPFDLVLLDIMMPRMNGYEVLERMRSDPHLRFVPVIMISAVDELDSVVKCIELGADDYLFKPFNPVLLKARVSASLEKKRLYTAAQGGGVPAAELKAPASSIKSDVDLLVSGTLGPVNPQQSEALGRIKSNLDHLLKLLGD